MIQAIRLPSAQSPFSERRTEQIQNTWLKGSCRDEWRLLVKSLGIADPERNGSSPLPRTIFKRGVREQRSKPRQITRSKREPIGRVLGRHSTSRAALFSVLGGVRYRRVQRGVSLHSSRTVPGMLVQRRLFLSADANAHARKASMTNPPLLMSCPPKEASSAQ